MNNKLTSYGCKILVMLILCISLPIVWLEVYIWQHCLWPPSGPNVEIIVSACKSPRLYSVSPNGRYILYLADYHGKYQSLLQDTTTGEERPAFASGRFWLSNTLFLDEGYPPQTRVADLSNESLTSLQWVQDMEGTTTQLANGSETYSSEVVKWFRNASQVYYIPRRRWAIALGPDFKAHPENNYILANRAYDFTNSILKFLKEHRIAYREIGYPNNGSDLISHNGRYVMPFLGPDGFYTAEGTRIGPFYDFIRDHRCCLAYGWAYDDSGIYVQGSTVGSGFMLPFPGQVQPILKLNLPPEYLSPAARQVQRSRQNQARMALIIQALVLIMLLVTGSWFFWRRKRKNIPNVS